MADRIIRAEEFVRAWQESATCAEVAVRLGINESHARTRASLLRKKGVPLKQHSAGSKPDYAKLAELARRLAAKE